MNSDQCAMAYHVPVILWHRTTATATWRRRRRRVRTIGSGWIRARRKIGFCLLVLSFRTMWRIEVRSICWPIWMCTSMSIRCGNGSCRWCRWLMRHFWMRRLMCGRLLHLSQLVIGRRRWWWWRRPMMTRGWSSLTAWSRCRSTFTLFFFI